MRSLTAACRRVTDHIRDRTTGPVTGSRASASTAPPDARCQYRNSRTGGSADADRADTNAAKPGFTIVRTHLYLPPQR